MLGFFVVIGLGLIGSALWVYKSYEGVFNSPDINNLFEPVAPFSIDYIYNIAAILLPVFLFWLLFVLVYFAYVLNRNQQYMTYLMLGNKKNGDYMEGLVREMMQSRQEASKSTFFASFDLVLESFSEIMLDIIVKAHLSSELVLAKLVDKPTRVKVWGLSNVIIESSQNLPNFELSMKNYMENGEGLSWSISQFMSKYDELAKTLRELEANKLLQEFVLAGNLAKVYFILSKLFVDKSEISR